jgi:hypothetical protein
MAIQNLFPEISPSLSLDFASVKKLDPRVTFARASSAVAYDGRTVAKAEENLLLRSQEFDNTSGWLAPSPASILGNTSISTAPDGTSTASVLTESATTTTQRIASVSITLPAVVHTLSVFAKPNGRDWLYLRYAATNRAWFDITNGVVGTSLVGANPVITSVGNGWYRCSINVTGTAVGSNVVFGMSNADNVDSYAGDGTSGLLLWGAQAEARSAPTAYIQTTTQPITNYIPTLLSAPANVARFDHNPVSGESLGLLVEELRTNLLTYSEDFANAVWTKTQSSITSNTIVAPDGTLTGDKLIANTSNADHSVNQTINASAVSTMSVFAKLGENNHVYLMALGTGGRRAAASFNLVNGTVRSTYTNVYTVNATTINAIGNGWYRCTLTFTPDATAATSYRIGADNGTTAINDSGIVYTGDGYSGIYIWGAQLE